MIHQTSLSEQQTPGYGNDQRPSSVFPPSRYDLTHDPLTLVRLALAIISYWADTVHFNIPYPATAYHVLHTSSA